MIKALGLWQPWAELVAAGLKRIETRSWEADGHYRGPLLVHATLKWAPMQREAWEVLMPLHLYPTQRSTTRPVLGHAIALVDLLDCVPMTAEWIRAQDPEERRMGDYQVGRWAWILGRVERLTPTIPLSGGQRLFNPRLDPAGTTRVAGLARTFESFRRIHGLDQGR